MKHFYYRAVGFVLLNLLFFTLPSLGQQQPSKRIRDTIPYEFIHDKIIIPVTVNGVSVKYIVDTGGKTGTVRQFAVDMGGKTAGNTMVSDLNRQSLSYETGILENVRLSANYQLSQLETMIFPSNGFFTTLGVAGILGADAFAQSVVTFDAREKIMVIDYPYRPLGLKITEGLEFVDNPSNHSIIRLNFGGEEIPALFDTGASGFLLLSTTDYISLRSKGIVGEESRGYGINGIGIGGLSQSVEFYKTALPRLEVLGKHFTGIGSITIPSRTIIGVDLLKYGKVIIDYMRKRFYFFPYDEEIVDLGGRPATWNVGILPVKDHFEVTTVWESIKNAVQTGDHVVNINGNDLKDVPLSEFAINDIMDAIEGEQAYILIRRGEDVKRIEIRKEQ